MEDQPRPDNVRAIREPDEVEKTNAVINEFTDAVFRGSGGNVVMAMQALQAKQLEILMTLMAEANLIDVKEFNRRMRLACKKSIEDMRKPKIAVATSIELPP